ncbi:MAG: DUF4347 domain-containing protein [Nitrospira sp.]|nr:DUF4347 domain-containing protein [Nitrospira sp.]
MKKKEGDEVHAHKSSKAPRPTGSLKSSFLSLEQRLMFDAAAAATAAEVASEQVAQEQADAAVSTDAEADTGRTGAASAESGDLLQALTTFLPIDSPTEIVFVDPTVPDYRTLFAGMDPNIEVVMLDGGQDGVEQIAASLTGRTGIDAIHIISHGDQGRLNLGTGTLNVDSMSGQYADELATIQQSLSEQADILVYGCDFAEGEAGQVAVDLLAEMTGADVQASTDETGHISLGGDWEFEVQTGTIETSLAVDYDTQMNWAGVLGTETASDTFSAESYGNNNGTQSWSTSWAETDAGGGGAGGGDVRVNSSQLRIDTDTVGNAISRGVNLSYALSATLTFNYTNALLGADRIEVRVSTDGGANYSTLGGGIFSSAANTGSGAASLNLSGYMSANTRIQFIVTGTGGGERLYVDNVQVSYQTNEAPTITSNGGGSTASVNVAENTSTVATVTAADANAGQTLTYSISGGADAAKFTINSSTGQLSSVTTPNYESPTDSGGNNIYDVTVQVSDGIGGVDTQAIAVTVTNVNEAPTITSLSGDSLSYNEGDGAVVIEQGGNALVTDVDSTNLDTGTLTVSIPAGGDSAEDVLSIRNQGTGAGQIGVSGNTLTYSGVTIGTFTGGSSGGNLVITFNSNATPTAVTALIKNITYQNTDTNAPTTGVRTVRYVLTDGDDGTSANYDTTVTVSGVNDAPTDLNLSANTVAENAANGMVVGTVSETDSDSGDSKTYSLADAAGGRFAIDSSTGQITVANGSLLNYETAASHSVTVRVTDSGGLTYDEAFAINLTNVNEAPAGADPTITISEDTAHTLTTANFGFSDVDAGDSLSAVRIDTLPSVGSLTLSGVAVTAGQVVSVADLTAGNLVFAPAADANGTGYANFTFSVRDSNNTYDTAPNTLTVNVTAVNDAPIAGNDNYTVQEDGILNVDVNSGLLATDMEIDGDAISTILVSGPSHGTLTLNPDGSFSYTPHANYVGPDSFTYRVTDGTLQSNLAAVSLMISPANDAPVVTPIAPDVTFVEGGLPQVFDATGTIGDVDAANFDGGSLTVSISVNGTADDRLQVGNFGAGSGQVGLSGSNVTYGGTVVGTVSGGTGGSDPLVVTFNVNATPSAVQEVYRSIQFDNVSDNPSMATRTLMIGLTDGDGGTAIPQTKLVYVQAANDAPTDLSLSSNTVAENAANGTVVGTVSGTDPDSGDTKTYSLTDTAGGRFAINSSSGVIMVADSSRLNYETATNHSVTVRVADSGGLTYDETVTINVTNVNEAPTGADATITINEDASHALTMADFGFSDVDAGDSVSAVRIDTVPGAGTLTLSGVTVTAGQVIAVADITVGNLVFTPAAEANGTAYASVIFSVRDSNNTYDTAPNTMTFNVTLVADAPVNTVPGSQTVTEDTPLLLSGISVNDVDVDLSTVQLGVLNGTVSVTLQGMATISAGSNGSTTLTLSGSQADINATLTTLAYQGAFNFTGSDTLTVTSTDATSGSDVDTVAITVTSQNDAPTLSANTGSTAAEGGIDTITASELAVTDVDNSATQLTYSIGTGPAYGRLELTTVPGVSATSFTQADIEANRLVYVHNGSESTGDSFTFTVSDAAGGLLGATTVTLTVAPVNDAPTIISNGGGAMAAINVAEHVSAVTVVGGADADLPAHVLTYSVSGGIDQARFTINAATGALDFSVPPDFELPADAEGDNVYVVEVRVTDSLGASVTQTLHVTVTDVYEVGPPATLPSSLISTTPPVASGAQPTAGAVRPLGFTPIVEGATKVSEGEQTPSAQPSAWTSQGPRARSAFSPDELRRAAKSIPPDSVHLQRVDESASSSQASFWVEPNRVDPDGKRLPPALLSERLLDELDAVIDGLQDALAVEAEQQILVTRVAAASGVALSVGFVVWALRSTALLTSFFATIPAWQMLDPLPVMASHRGERERRRRAQERIARRELAKFRGLQHMFDHKGAKPSCPPTD